MKTHEARDEEGNSNDDVQSDHLSAPLIQGINAHD